MDREVKENGSHDSGYERRLSSVEGGVRIVVVLNLVRPDIKLRCRHIFGQFLGYNQRDWYYQLLTRRNISPSTVSTI